MFDFSLILILSGTVSDVRLETINKPTIDKEFDSRVVGGEPVDIVSYPHAVQFFNDGAMCGGSLISSYAVLTAAHCFDYNKDIDEMIIIAGARYTLQSDADVYGLIDFYIHKEYNTTTLFANDIALIFVKGPVSLGSRARKAILVDSDYWTRDKRTNFVITGWGVTSYKGQKSKDGLLMTRLSYVPLDKCMQLHGLKFTEDMFCLHGRGETDSCQGDSGGAVLWNDMVVGIVSHGDGCAQKDKPSIYANVWYFRNWIKDNMLIFIEKYCKAKEN